ncbi:primosomal protein N' [Solicola gregarius]|uniref:Probable replication restart protein PriA n=1 Tax=Solicola gregarius TaxID=2908642 RepID=A0AA46THI4_9ACTN|nr:primosomal protein N' [Solicola gregarius]UYM05240.1 primosomal protein N' [Solicola gregarius]
MSDDHEQLALLKGAVRRPKVPDGAALAPELPVARVAVDVSLAHLDRPFDYLVPEAMHDTAVPGSRVVVRFAGQQVSGFVLDRVAESDHTGRLGRLSRAVSDEVVLRPDVARLVRTVADRYAGTFADVVRLAVPPRHATTEKRAARTPAGPVEAPADLSGWDAYAGGAEYVSAIAAGDRPRAVWSALPGASSGHDIALAVAATVAAGRGAIVCVPDATDVARVGAAMADVLGAGRHVELTAALGPSARYRAFLSLARGLTRVVVGTRAAAFAPVHDLGLVAIWDDADDLHAEPRAPYPHAREVLLTRAHDAGCAALIGGYARSAEAQRLIESGWCDELGPSLPARRASWARVAVTGADERAAAADLSGGRARLPHEAFTLIRSGLDAGPVLVQVPRLGYRSALACQRCRTPARCAHCAGPMAQRSSDAEPTCRWCGRDGATWSCGECGSVRMRAVVVGDARTAEELGRAFPQVPVVTSSGEHVRERVSAEAVLVVATPGAEPATEGGYAAGVLMDCGLMLSRPDLRVAEESLRRWLNATALVRGAEAGGRVLAIGDQTLGVLQALVRLDPAGHARRELAERQAAHLPPAVILAAVEGPVDELEALIDHEWPQPFELLGPVEIDDDSARLIVRVPRHRGGELAEALRELQAGRSARKLSHLRVDVDPAQLA